MEVRRYVPDAQDRITFRHYQGVPYVLLENASGRFLFAGGFQGDVLHFGIEPQSVEAFRLLGDVLRREGFPLNKHYPSVELYRAYNSFRRSGSALSSV